MAEWWLGRPPPTSVGTSLMYTHISNSFKMLCKIVQLVDNNETVVLITVDYIFYTVSGEPPYEVHLGPAAICH